jgi:hypothetical protein
MELIERLKNSNKNIHPGFMVVHLSKVVPGTMGWMGLL